MPAACLQLEVNPPQQLMRVVQCHVVSRQRQTERDAPKVVAHVHLVLLEHSTTPCQQIAKFNQRVNELPMIDFAFFSTGKGEQTV